MNKRAVIYCRVSTKEQVDEGNSLATQERHCRDYALKNGYEIAEVFIEQGESAKTAQRTELQRLLSFCADKKNQVNAVISYKIDRISRNTDDYSQIRILLKRYGVEIKSTSEYFENTPAGRFMENIIANVAQFDNDVRTERSIGGMRDAMKEGRYVWAAPIGYINHRIQGKSTIKPNETARVVQETFAMVAENIMPLSEVRNKMTQKGLIGKKGAPLTRSYFYKMLKNELYAGWIVKFGEKHRGTYAPLVSDDLFNQVQRVLTYRTRRTMAYNLENPDFPLRRFIKHPSGRKLTGGWSTGRRKKYAHYTFHQIKGLSFRRDDLNQIFKDFLNQFKLDTKQFKKLQQYFQSGVINTDAKYSKDIESLEKQIAELNVELRELSKNKAKGLVSDYLFQQQVGFIEKELLTLNSQLFAIPKCKTFDFESALSFTHEFLKRPSETWEKASFNQKLKLQWFYFPQGITLDERKCRTDEICFLFKVKDFFLTHLSSSVPSENRKKYTNKIPENFKTRMEQELIRLSEIVREESGAP